MSNHGDNSIVVKIEITLPGSAPRRIDVPLADLPCTPPSVSLPATTTASVKTAGGASTGVICVTGIANCNGQPAELVATRLFQGTYTGVPSPTDPANSTTTTSGTGDFKFNSLGTAACNNSTGAMNTLFVWARYNNTWTSAISRNFSGICASATDCGGAFAEPGGAGSAPASIGLPALETAAAEWSVEAHTFAGPSTKAFNGKHRLRLTDPSGGSHVWTNDGDGSKVPAVTLQVEPCCSPQVTLSFQLGKRSVHYSMPATSFHPAGPNVLVTVTSTGLKPGESIPAEMALHPA